MKKILANTFLISSLPAFLTQAHACGMPAAPGASELLCLGEPIDLLIVLLLTGAFVAAVGPSLRKGLSWFGRSSS